MKPYPNIQDLERQSGITWRQLAEQEPGLEDLLWRARQACVTCRRWSDVDRVFAPIRNVLAELAGFASRNHRHPVLGCAGAYQVAYWKLYDAVAGLLPGRAGCANGLWETHCGQIVTETHPAAPAALSPALA